MEAMSLKTSTEKKKEKERKEFDPLRQAYLLAI
jgi:hypothetical protein